MSGKAKLKRAMRHVSRELVAVHDEMDEVRNFLEALHMMAMDLESTPHDEATPAFRAVAQAAIDRCGKVVQAVERGLHWTGDKPAF